MARLTILFFIILLRSTLLLSQDEKYRPPKSFGSEREYIEYRISSINDVSITTSLNEIIVGKLLFMTDSSLTICITDDCHNWRNQPVLSFNYSEINRLKVMKKGQGPKRAGIGFLVGGAIGASVGLMAELGCTGFCVGQGRLALTFGIVLGIPGAIIGGIVGSNQDKHYQINGNLHEFRYLHKKLGNEVIFSELPKNKLIQD